MGIVLGVAANQQATISVAYREVNPNLFSSAQVHTRSPWPDAAGVEYLGGAGKSSAFKAGDKALNILFLPEGFTKEASNTEQDYVDFKRFAGNLIKQVCENQFNAPST